MHADSRTPTTWAHAGITLIELMVVLAIVAGIAAISFSAFGSLTNATLRAEAMRMSGALRMVYGRAAINGLRYQVTVDIEGNTFSVQCSPDNVLIPEGEGTADDEGLDALDDDEADPFGLGVERATLDDCAEPLLETTAMRGDVEIARVLTTHHKDPVEEGTATIAYFPNGFVERSLIWLKSRETFLSLSIEPMSGRVVVHAGDLDVPDDFFEVEED